MLYGPCYTVNNVWKIYEDAEFTEIQPQSGWPHSAKTEDMIAEVEVFIDINPSTSLRRSNQGSMRISIL